ncbi:transketolase [Bradyrhizobium lablabi]|nr:transketolase [Bradyrhizobium lablabi]
MEAAARGRQHIGSALSIVDILTILYFRHLRLDPSNLESGAGDRFLLSKGHGASALYATLLERGILAKEIFSTFGLPDSRLCGHPTAGTPGVEISTGSLGHGLAIAAGMALGARLDRSPMRVVVCLGDGELNEGSNWEAALFSAHQKLAPLVAIVDRNGLQQEGPTEEVASLEPLAHKWESFGWSVCCVCGHDFPALHAALSASFSSKRPAAVIAKTTKGRGVSFMENRMEWHMAQLSGSELDRALLELNQN